MFNLFNVFKKSVEDTIKRDVISNSKVTTPISKPVNKMEKLNKTDFIILNKGKYEYWEDFLNAYNEYFNSEITLQGLWAIINKTIGSQKGFVII